MADERLQSSECLRHRHEFQRVFEQGRKHVSPEFVLYALPTSASCSRLGIAVSKRVGNAVVRNRVKRRTRECFRRHKELLDPPCDLVVVARRRAAEVPSEVYQRQLLIVLRRCRQH